jgi:hypothetical protein
VDPTSGSAFRDLDNEEDEEDEDEDEEDPCTSCLRPPRPAASGHWTTNVSTNGRRSLAERESESTRAKDST